MLSGVWNIKDIGDVLPVIVIQPPAKGLTWRTSIPFTAKDREVDSIGLRDERHVF